MARWVRRRLLHRRPRQTTHDVDDGSQIGPLLDQITDSLASFTGDGAYDQAGVYDTVAKHHPEADVIVPLRSSAVPGKVAETTPTQRDRHLQSTAQYGRMGWQKPVAAGYGRQPRARSRERRRQHDGGAQQASLDPAPESVVGIEADRRERVPDATEVDGSAR